MSDQGSGPGGKRVVATYGKRGRFAGFKDPDAPDSGFLRRDEAISRLRHDPVTGNLYDSAGHRILPFDIRFELRPVTLSFANAEVEYKKLRISIDSYVPAGNEEILERVVVRRQDGTLETFYISHGLGSKAENDKAARKWGAKLRDAAGLKEGEKVPTDYLQKFVVSNEYLIKTTKKK